MSSVEKLIDRSLQTGLMTEEDHDNIMNIIHKDGRIDAVEQVQISRLFDAVKRGTIRIVDEAPTVASSMSMNWLSDKKIFSNEKIPSVSDRSSYLNKNQEEEPVNYKALLNESSGLAIKQKPQSNLSVKSKDVDESEEEINQPSHNQKASEKASFSKQAKGPRQFGDAFSLRSERLLDVALNGNLWIKSGSMVGYYGIIKFEREGIFEHGLNKVLKRKVTGEGTMLTKATGSGNLFLADQGKKISLYEVGGRSLVVNGANVLAFQDSVQWDVTMLKQLAAIWTGGFFNVRLFGQGTVAVTTHYDPIVLRVTPAEPLMTDMAATVAWSGDLVPEIKTDITSSTMIGRGSGETIQMKFNGDGFVVIQPFEEVNPERSKQ